MGCPGVHCPGCSGGQSIIVLGAVAGAAWVADIMVRWVADRIWWIGGTLVVCTVLAIAASMALGAWADRRGERYAAARGILSRADVMAAGQIGQQRAVTILPPVPERPALEPRAVHIHFHGLSEVEQAVVIRRALERE